MIEVTGCRSQGRPNRGRALGSLLPVFLQALRLKTGGNGVPMVSGRWAVSLRPAACPGLHLLVVWGSQSSRHRHGFCSLAVGLHKLPGLE